MLKRRLAQSQSNKFILVLKANNDKTVKTKNAKLLDHSVNNKISQLKGS